MEKERKILVIPKELEMEVRTLSDDASEARKKGRGSVEHARLWTRITEIYPEALTGKWHLDSSSPFRVELVEGQSEEAGLASFLSKLAGERD